MRNICSNLHSTRIRTGRRLLFGLTFRRATEYARFKLFLLSVFSTHLIGCVSSLLHPANIFCSAISSSPSEFTAFLQPSCRPAKSPASNPSTMHKSVPVAGGGRVRLFPTDLFAGLLCARSAISAADRPFLGMLPLLPRMEMAQRTKTSRGRELRCRSKPARNSNLRESRIGAEKK